MKNLRWTGTSIGFATALLIGADNAFAQRGSDYCGWFGPGMMGGWGGGWFGMIFMVAFWVLVIAGLFFLVKWLIQTIKGERTDARGGSRALDIIKERYARGEISKDQFDSLKKDLVST